MKTSNKFIINSSLLGLFVLSSTSIASAYTNEVTIATDGAYRYIQSNSIPNHDTGEFPNSGNPNSISEQEISQQMTLNPVYVGGQVNSPLPGIALNGVLLEPGTGESYQNQGEYRYEALQDTMDLGLDDNNAHVQPTGKYHYHGIPTGLIETLDQSDDLVHVGYAADGFKMYYSQSEIYDTAYQLKSGTRSSGPGGEYDGTFTSDFEYISGLGDLDACNGITVDGEYLYVITSDFPYISRCLNGTPDDSFRHGGGGGSQEGGGETGERPERPEMGGNGETGERPERPEMGGGERPERPEMGGDSETGETKSDRSNARKAKYYQKFSGELESAKSFSDADQIKNLEAVNMLQQRGIIDGNDDGSFAPERGINRAESLKVLLEALGIDVNQTVSTSFSDIDSSAWYSNYVGIAKERNIIEGYDDGSFRPSETVNQAELLKIAFESFGIDLSDYDTDGTAWYSAYVEYAADHDLIDESTPAQTMSRSAFSELIYRLILQQESL